MTTGFDNSDFFDVLGIYNDLIEVFGEDVIKATFGDVVHSLHVGKSVV
jgi:hypothetical protein